MEELNLAELDLSKPEDVARLREAFQSAHSAADEAKAEIAKSAARERTRSVQDYLRELNAPESVADVYPSDAKLDKDSVRSFLKDTIGMEPDNETDAWRRYEAMQNKGTPPVQTDELDDWIQSEMKNTEDFYRKQNAPTDEELKNLNELKAKVYKKLTDWDQDVNTGKMDPIISPQGFGGFLDPPAYARRARNFVSMGT